MATIAFDTLKLAKGLEEAGFAHEQALKTAEVLSATIGESVVTREHFDLRMVELDHRFAELDHRMAELDHRLAEFEVSTKADIKALEASTKADIKVLEASTKTEIAMVKSEIIKWMFGAMIAQTAVIAALVKLL